MLEVFPRAGKSARAEVPAGPQLPDVGLAAPGSRATWTPR